jgi:hypothetical protein
LRIEDGHEDVNHKDVKMTRDGSVWGVRVRGMLLVVAVLLGSCGGGGSGTMAPSGLGYPSAPAFVIQQPIEALTPTVTGQISSYTVSPALPAGLSINSSSGVISGTPTAITPKTTYTVTAENAGGSATASVSLVVNDVVPSVSYASPYYGFTAGIAAQAITPAHSGGAVVSWSVAPALPTGLAISTSTGVISGIPTVAVAPASYVVTAANSGGQAQFDLTIAVAAAPLLELGHADPVVLIRPTASAVLSLDSAGHWLLQDIASGTALASGDGACGTALCLQNAQGGFTHLPVDLAGGTMIDVAAGGLEVRSSSDGHLLATIPGQFSWYQLASDGSYVSAGSATALMAWTTSGQLLFSHPGDYQAAVAFSAPGQVRVALGAAGKTVIETIATATGTSSVSAAFQGNFSSWFSDGGRFLTTLSTTVWTYSSTAVQQDVTQVSATDNLAGEGNWFWTYDVARQLTVYQVGSSATPAFSSPIGDVESHDFPSGTTIGIPAGGAGQITVIDLSGATPVSAVYTTPIAYLYAYGATSSSAWFAANQHGVLLDGASLATQPRYLTLGDAWSIAGGAGYLTVATASGEIFNYDASSDALVGTIAFSSSQVALSTSGSVLAALSDAVDAQYEPGQVVNIYALPSGNVINSFPNTGQAPLSISLSGSGTVLGENYASSSPGCNNEVISTTGSTPIWCATNPAFQGVQLSPDGTLIAASTSRDSSGSANIYKNAVLASAVPGWAVGWLDNTRLLATTVDSKGNYTGAVIYGPTGSVIAKPPIPQIYSMNVVTPESIYSPELNIIVSLTSGATAWMSGNTARQLGAVTGSQVIFASGSRVLVQPY